MGYASWYNHTCSCIAGQHPMLSVSERRSRAKRGAGLHTWQQVLQNAGEVVNNALHLRSSPAHQRSKFTADYC